MVVRAHKLPWGGAREACGPPGGFAVTRGVGGQTLGWCHCCAHGRPWEITPSSAFFGASWLLSPEPPTRYERLGYVPMAAGVPDWHGRRQAWARVPTGPVLCTDPALH